MAGAEVTHLRCQQHVSQLLRLHLEASRQIEHLPVSKDNVLAHDAAARERQGVRAPRAPGTMESDVQSRRGNVAHNNSPAAGGMCRMECRLFESPLRHRDLWTDPDRLIHPQASHSRRSATSVTPRRCPLPLARASGTLQQHHHIVGSPRRRPCNFVNLVWMPGCHSRAASNTTRPRRGLTAQQQHAERWERAQERGYVFIFYRQTVDVQQRQACRGCRRLVAA